MTQRVTAPPRTIADLVTSTLWLDASTPVGNVVRIFERDPVADSVAIVDGARIGLIARSRFFLQLGQRFGYSLYEHRPARLLMEEGSTVDESADPVEVIALATQREPERLYDDILVLTGGRYAGTVSMRSLLVHHKDLLLQSVAEIGSLGDEVARLRLEHGAAEASHARALEEARLSVHAIRGALRLLVSDAALPGKHLKTVGELLARSQELLGALGAR
jgi:two-component system, cell cycle sensor histidine kinase PleC